MIEESRFESCQGIFERLRNDEKIAAEKAGCSSGSNPVRPVRRHGIAELTLRYVSILVVHVTEYLDIGKFPDKIW